MTRTDRPNSGWTRVALLVAILLSSLLVSVNRDHITPGSTADIAAQETVAPIADIASRPIRAVENIIESAKLRRRVHEENLALKAKIAVLQDRQARYENLAMKVARYEAILGVDTETDVPLRKIAARAVGETDGPFVRSLLLNVGEKDGVSLGNPVMSPAGLVGHVINTGPNTARVLQLSDLNSRIAVASAESGATAILAGDNTVQPKLAFINLRKDWTLGDRVISSGDEGSMPRGLHIGTVVADDMGELRVDLAAQKQPLDWVFVSPFAPISAPADTTDEDAASAASAAGQP